MNNLIIIKIFEMSHNMIYRKFYINYSKLKFILGYTILEKNLALQTQLKFSN